MNQIALLRLRRAQRVAAILGVAVVMGSGSFAQTPSGPAALGVRPPQIMFAATSHDFGRVKRGEVRRHSFSFVNQGDAPLELDVHPTCSCTRVEPGKRQVPPGKAARIDIEFDSANQNGLVTKSIMVFSNDPANPRTTLQFTAAVWSPIEVAPSTVMFQFVADAAVAETRTVKIVNHAAEALTLKPPVSSTPAFRASLKTVEIGREFEVTITTVPPIGTGTVSGVIALQTSSAEVPGVEIQAHAVERPAIVVSPPQLRLATPLPAAGLRSTISIMSMGAAPLVLNDAQVSAAAVGVAVREVQPGKLFAIELRFPADYVPPADGSVLTVKSNHPRHSVITIPITAAGRSEP